MYRTCGGRKHQGRNQSKHIHSKTLTHTHIYIYIFIFIFIYMPRFTSFLIHIYIYIYPNAPTCTNTVNIRQCKLSRRHGFRFCQRSFSEQHSKSDFPIRFLCPIFYDTKTSSNPRSGTICVVLIYATAKLPVTLKPKRIWAHHRASMDSLRAFFEKITWHRLARPCTHEHLSPSQRPRWSLCAHFLTN